MAIAMASMASRVNPLLRFVPHFLTWRALGFRTVCSGRLGFATQSEKLDGTSSSSAVAGTKVLETFREDFEVGSQLISLETGKIARFANGAVVLGVEGTTVLSTVASSKSGDVRDFLPLTVDYQEKKFAKGVIPNTYMRREGAPKERELLCGRLIDRPIRPLFPAGFYHEVQVTASVLSCDGKQDPDVMAANATSTALMLSDIPWGGPIGMIRIGRIAGKFIVNPTMDELCISDLNLVYACTKDKTLMIDVQAREISEKDLEAGLRFAHPEAVKFLEPQIRLASKAGRRKKEYKLSMLSDRTMERVHKLAEASIEAVFTDPTYGKFERGEALDNIMQDVKKVLQEECDEESLKVLPKAVDTVRKRVVRKRVIDEGLRVDGRALDEVRPVFCESHSLPHLHGSSIFSRGDTQVLCTVTLGSPGDAQKLDSLVGPSTKRFMLHYSFPPFSINEVGKQGGMNRREVGHGTLAEKALLAVLPPDEDLPYTVRVNSEVMGSDGSTSMATVCGGSMALMDAGIPVREHVAGVSVGLISDVDPSTGEIKDYRILTDILGLEDHLGDMDFKIAGTRKGVTAIQLDIKPAGIPLDIICESLEPARNGRIQILDHMEREINAPRTQDARNSPQIVTMKYSNDSLRRLVGPLGVLKRKIEEETGGHISLSDGTLTIMARNQSVMDKVQEKIEFILGREIEVGGIYKGVVITVKEYGAFIEFNGGQQGLLHISELSHGPVSRVSDVVAVGQTLSLMCIGQDVRGNIKLSLKATLPQPYTGEGKVVTATFPSLKGDIKTSASEESSDTSDDKSEERSEVSLDPSSSSVPPIIIRSAAECEEAEKAAGLTQKTKRKSKLPDTAEAEEKNAVPIQKPKSKAKSSRASQEDKKVKPVSMKKGGKGLKIVLKTEYADEITKLLEKDTATKYDLQTAKRDELTGAQAKSKAPTKLLDSNTAMKYELKKAKRDVLTPTKLHENDTAMKYELKTAKRDVLTPTKLHENDTAMKYELKTAKRDVLAPAKILENDTATKYELKTARRDVLSDTEAKAEAPITTKSLKLGTKVNAKVYQVRTHGLVLDLGGGLRGMYRFENGKTDFEVGDELRVQCLSFSSKGIPVLSLVDD